MDKAKISQIKDSLAQLQTQVSALGSTAMEFAHTPFILTRATHLDNALELALLATMQRRSKDLHKSLFRGYGPLSTFSAKIDTCYALGIISDNDYSELTKIRKIRNAVAHSDTPVTFEASPLRELFNPLRVPDGVRNDTKLHTFMGCAEVLIKKIAEYVNARFESEASSSSETATDQSS